MVCGKVLWWEGRLTKKTWNATWFVGRFFGAKVDWQKKTWNATWLVGRFFGAKVDSQKKHETPHGLWEGSLVRRSTHKKNLKRHMACGKVLWCEGRLTNKHLKRHMVLWEGFLARRSTHKKNWNATWFVERFFGAKVDSQKKLETPHGLWEGSLVRRSTHKKTWNATWFVGRFFGAKVDSQKKLKRRMVCGKVLWCELTKKIETPHGLWEDSWRKVDWQRKLETPHGLWEGSLVRRSTHKKNLKRHMVCGKVLWCEGRLTKKTWKTTWFVGRFFGEKVDWQKKLETPHGLWEGSLVRRSTDQKNMRRHMVCGKVLWCEGRLTKKTWNATWFVGRFFGAKVDSQKKLERHMVCGKVLWCEGRLTKKTWNATWFVGRFFGAKVDSQKKLETPHGFMGKFFCAKVDSQKKLEMQHGFLGRFFGAKVDSQKKLETPHGLWEGSLVRRSTHKENLKRHMV